VAGCGQERTKPSLDRLNTALWRKTVLKTVVLGALGRSRLSKPVEPLPTKRLFPVLCHTPELPTSVGLLCDRLVSLDRVFSFEVATLMDR
jgi:hypothetical protein